MMFKVPSDETLSKGMDTDNNNKEDFGRSLTASLSQRSCLLVRGSF